MDGTPRKVSKEKILASSALNKTLMSHVNDNKSTNSITRLPHRQKGSYQETPPLKSGRLPTDRSQKTGGSITTLNFTLKKPPPLYLPRTLMAKH